MEETRYLISETAKLVQVEPHVLRYWEEELDLSIKRNEMGHRYYTDKDLKVFQKIKELKKQGLQLRTIRQRLHETEKKEEEQPDRPCQEKAHRDAAACPLERVQVKIVTPQKFRQEVTEQEMSENEKEEKQIRDERFQEIMKRLIHDIELKERKEGRYRRLDEAIRRHQQSRKMVAATRENQKNRKKR